MLRLFFNVYPIENHPSSAFSCPIPDDRTCSIFEVAISIKPYLRQFKNILGLNLGNNGYSLLDDVDVNDILELKKNFGRERSKPIVITLKFKLKFSNNETERFHFASLIQSNNALEFLAAHFKPEIGKELDAYLGADLITMHMSIGKLLELNTFRPISLKISNSISFTIRKLSATKSSVISRIQNIAKKIEFDEVSHFLLIARYISKFETEDEGCNPFVFVIGPSGSGKTLLSFILEQFVVCIRFNMVFFSDNLRDPLGKIQDIYRSSEDISKELFKCLKYDLSLMPDLKDHRMSTSHIKNNYGKTKLRSLGLLKTLLIANSKRPHVNHTENNFPDPLKGVFTYHEMTISEFLTWHFSGYKQLHNAVIFLDEFAGKISLSERNIEKSLMVLARNLFSITGIPVFVMGTEASAANLLEESQIGTAGSSVQQSDPWCIVISKLPKPTANSILCFNDCVRLFQNSNPSWNGFAEFMGLKGTARFPSIRPFLLDWAYDYIRNNIQKAFAVKTRPIDFFEAMILSLKENVFAKKPRLKRIEGRCAQFVIHFPFCREDVCDGPACFINSHFAFLRDPRPKSELRELNFSSIHRGLIEEYINLSSTDMVSESVDPSANMINNSLPPSGDMVNEFVPHSSDMINESAQSSTDTEIKPVPFSDTGNLLTNCFPVYRIVDDDDGDGDDKVLLAYSIYGETHDWEPRSFFPKFSDDVLMYMTVHTFKYHSSFQRVNASKNSSTFKTSCSYFKTERLHLLNHHSSHHRNGVAFEHMFHVVVVVASQRNGLRGTSIADFIMHFIRELDAGFNLPRRLNDLNQVLENLEENVLVPFFPTIGSSLPTSLSNMDNVIAGKFVIVPDKEQVDGIGTLSNGGLLILECKNWKDNIDKNDYEKIVVKGINHFMNVKSSFNLHFLCANTFAVGQMVLDDICAGQDEAFLNYAKGRSLRFYCVERSSNMINLAELATFESTASYSGVDLFLIFSMKDLFPFQDFSFLPPPHDAPGKRLHKRNSTASTDDAGPAKKLLKRRSERRANSQPTLHS